MPKVNLYKLKKLISSIILVSVIFSAGYLIGNHSFKINLQGNSKVKIERNVPSRYKDVDFSLFWEVWDTLKESYYDQSKIDKGNMVYGAIEGMVSALGDPYTVFLPPEENKVVQEDLEGSFGGIGIQIGFKGTQLAVIAPLADTPAEKAGIEAGDFIIGIKDEKKDLDIGTSGLSLPDAVKAIRGPAGSVVTLALLREGETKPLIVDVVRGKITVPSVILSYKEKDGKKIAYVKLLKFAAETDGQWDKVVKEILKSDANSIVLDLRNNPGGYLLGAVDIAGEFLKNNTLVVMEQGPDGHKNEFRTSGFPRLANYNLVILVNKGSASASEILAAALREQMGVKLIGETTFGKGTIQEPRQVDGSAGLHITTAKWLTPKSEWINEKGIKPDIEVKDDLNTKEDEQLQKSLDLL